jgi:hypothetical protein
MTAISDRATVSLALECASRLVGPTSHEMTMYTRLEAMLKDAEEILLWHDRMCAERARRDSVRANAPRQEFLPNLGA